VLSATLRRLECHGLVAREVYAEVPVRVEYALTPLGWQLTEPLMALYEWALEHERDLAMPASAQPPLTHPGAASLATSAAA
jgi:DNA-binding HxlR family transcriptional regulator